MFKTISEVKETNKANGYFFFSKDTMRFFASKIESSLYKNQCFVTSEKKCFDDYTRVYNVRKVKPNASIITIEKNIEDLETARRIAKNS